MHSKQIVHGDLKAQCAAVRTATRRPAAKVSDLGRSRDLTQRPGSMWTRYAAGRGDLSHAPPEAFVAVGQRRPCSRSGWPMSTCWGRCCTRYRAGDHVVTLPDWMFALSRGQHEPARQASFRAAGRSHGSRCTRLPWVCWRMRHRPRYGTSSWTWCARCATPYLLVVNAGSAQSQHPSLGAPVGDPASGHHLQGGLAPVFMKATARRRRRV